MSLSSLTDRYTQARDCGDGHPERPPEFSRKSWAGDAGEPAPLEEDSLYRLDVRIAARVPCGGNRS